MPTIINSKFRPFSFQEMLQPVAMAAQAHQQLEDQYADLNTKASIWEKLANSAIDKDVYNQYKAYSDDLRAQADQLAQFGLNASSRRNMLNMRARYAQEITPIEEAYQARAQEIKEQIAGRAQGIVYAGDASQTGLSRYMQNPQAKYGFANSQEGYKRVQNAAVALSKELTRGLDSYGRGKKLDAYTNTWLQKYGYKSTEIAQAISDIQSALRGEGNIRGNNVLNSILQNEMNTSGVNTWDNKQAQLDYYNRIAPALYQAIGETKIGTFTDQGALLAAQEAKEKRVAAYRKSLEGTAPTSNPVVFAPRLLEGAQGEVNKEQADRLAGFRRSGYQSFTTQRLSDYSRNVASLRSELSKYSKEDLDKFRRYEDTQQTLKSRANNKLSTSGTQTLAAGMSSSINNPQPQGYNEYKRLQKQLDTANKNLADEQKYLKGIYDKYSHLGNTQYDAMRLGMELENLQQKQELSSFAYNAEETDYNKVRKGISNVITSIGKDALNKGNIGVTDDKGNSLDYDEVVKLLDKNTIDNLNLKVRGGKNPELVIVKDGETYHFKGIEQIDKFNKDLKITDNFLSDFTKSAVKNAHTLTLEELQGAINNDWSLAIANSDKQSLGNGLYGTVVYDPNTNDYIKVISNSNGQVQAVNVLSDELRGGSNRDQYFMSMANQGFNNIKQLLAADR